MATAPGFVLTYDPLGRFHWISNFGSVKVWLYSDAQGSIVAMAGSDGKSLAANSYGPYGEPGLTAAGRFGYSEHAAMPGASAARAAQAYLPELGLYYYKARMYSPWLGRFLQSDPVGTDGGMNLYEYAASDPINQSDPDGLSPELPDGTIVVTAGRRYRPSNPHARYNQIGGGASGLGALIAGAISSSMQALNLPIFPSSLRKLSTAASNRPQKNPICPRNGFTDALGKLRALPATAAGLVAGYVAGVGQELSGGPAVHIGVGNNAIQFTGLTGGDPAGFTLGNVQLYGAGTGPGGPRGRYDGGAASGNMGSHEEGHTYQFQSYGLAYMGYQFGASKLGNSRTNAMENQADNYADKGPRCP